MPSKQNLSAYIRVDGKYLPEYNEEVSDDGKTISCWIPSEAGKVEGDEGASAVDPDMGQISFTVHQVKVSPPDAEADITPVHIPPLVINERAKKGTVHGIRLGDEKVKRKPGRPFRRTRAEKLVVRFVFKYRPISVLIANGIAPPPPPEQQQQISNGIIDLTLDDDDDKAERKIRELREQLDTLERQLRQKKRKRNLSDAGIKREVKDEIDLT
ncbi:hypothetical protein CVT24_008631 [Panaeolus cyanescens]|uniref:Uncharacterized protein n=1 Tax=Panaeolus cyanescens TaxID=181874 RepID=A0A409VB79_9AGAR|nr:hypothetical protein CVT24_008631 [Panaeolus cyanescens]